MIDVIKLIKNKFRILLRQHPNLKISEQKSLLNILSRVEYDDVSLLAWDKFIIKNKTIALTPFSSAAIEAITHGSVLIWTPYYSDASVTNHGLINKVGKVCSSINKLELTIENLRNEEKRIDALKKQKKTTCGIC